jgi:hypothetical protein
MIIFRGVFFLIFSMLFPVRILSGKSARTDPAECRGISEKGLKDPDSHAL